MDSNLTTISKKEIKSHAKQKWKLVSNVLRACILFKTQEVHVINDIDKLVEDVKSSPLKPRIRHFKSLTQELISDHKLTEKLFFHILRSNSEDLIEINDLLENDPKRFTRSRSDPESFINKPNINGLRPLYEACKNGYLNTVQLLLDHGANPHLLIELEKDDKENALDVSCRWNHFYVVRCLLNASSWTNNELKKALRKCEGNIRVKELIREFAPARSGGICGR